MERTRVAVLAALSVVLSVVGAAFAAGASPAPGTLGAVSWPVSTLLVSEVQTAGASASDEFAEITNVGASAVDLAGLELVYVTSTGTTVTRKASWSGSLVLEPGRHVFAANTSGAYASLADTTYSGGFAATGGAIALRVIGGATIDAVGWGDATNAFVEGSPAGAPAAGSSIERKPGGLAGNTADTNANSVDWISQAAPNPQSLAAPPVPAPAATAALAPTPSPSPTIAPTSTPGATTVPTATAASTPPPAPSATPFATPDPTAEITPEPTASPTTGTTAEPTTAATPAPTVEPTAIPEATPTPLPTPGPTGAPTAEPTLVPTPTSQPIVAISTARGHANGSSATIAGVLTTSLGALESGRKAFVQDDTAGIAIYLDAAVVDGLAAGSLVIGTGTLDDRFAERTLRVNLVDLQAIAAGDLPAPALQPTGSIGEGAEGSRVVVAGVTVGSPGSLADGLGLMVDDGSGGVRVIVAPAALGGSSVPSGTSVIAIGPVGQRDSSGTDAAGYRIHVTQAGDFQVVPPPTPSPTTSPSVAPAIPPTPVPTAAPSQSAAAGPTPTPSPGATPTPRPTQSVAPTPSPSPTQTSGPTPPPVLDIVEARGAHVGAIVTVAGVVTAEAGRLGSPPVIAIADGTAGIAVRVPDGVPAPGRGSTVLIKGQLADPYGQLELRPAPTGFAITGRGSLPGPIHLTAAQLGEATEGRLGDIVGTVGASPRKSASGDLTIDLVDAAGTPFRVIADGSSGVSSGDLAKDRAYRITGIVGQRASRKGALDGYRLYLRDRADIVAVASPGGSGASPAPGAGGEASAVPISTALAVPDDTRLTIEATVTAGAALLDSSGRRIVVQDRTGAIEVLLPTGTRAPGIGAKLRVSGTTGRAWGAKRIAATEVATLGAGDALLPATLRRAPAERDEWLLVRIGGTVAKVTRIGERWRAEVTLADGVDAVVQGQAGAGIPSTSIITGRQITVAGIVRRPYPTATDRRFAILPRSGADVALGSASGRGSASAGIDTRSTASSGAPAESAAAITPDTDLAALADFVGQRVKVGGLIARVAEDGFDLDDGTALARVELRGDFRSLLPHLRAGEAIAAAGKVELVHEAPVVVVDGDGTLVRVGTLGQALPIGDGPTPGPSDTPRGGPVTAESSVAIGGPAPLSLLALASLIALSVLATLVRKRLLQRRLRLALVERLATLPTRRGRGGPGDLNVKPATAEHESA